MVRKISGKGCPDPIKPLSLPDGRVLETRPEIANTIASTISHNSSSANLPPGFQHVKEQAEQTPIDFDAGTLDPLDDEIFNSVFTWEELQHVLGSLKSTAAGPDEISNDILKLLPDASLHTILAIL